LIPCLKYNGLVQKFRHRIPLITDPCLFYNSHSLHKVRNEIGLFNTVQSYAYAAVRTTYLATLFTPLIIAFPIYYFLSRENDMWWVYWFVWSLEKSGPTFTKV
jgi:hypothetical protein